MPRPKANPRRHTLFLDDAPCYAPHCEGPTLALKMLARRGNFSRVITENPRPFGFGEAALGHFSKTQDESLPRTPIQPCVSIVFGKGAGSRLHEHTGSSMPAACLKSCRRGPQVVSELLRLIPTP